MNQPTSHLDHSADAFRQINQKSDNIMNYVLIAYYGTGWALAAFYETWFIALGVGSICIVAYYLCKYLLPDSKLYQYVLSALFAIFSAQFIYQMHGQFEMHFFFFVGAALLVTFRNWKLFIPLLLLTVIHHASFAWLQYQGMREIYFTQLDYMNLQAFIFHALLAAIIMGVCAYWSYDLEQTTRRDVEKNGLLANQVVNMKNNIEFANQISGGNLDYGYALLDKSDDLGLSLLKMRENLKVSNARESDEKFITIGITKVGDIIRQHGGDTKQLAEEFIRGMVKYCGLNQAGLFIHEQEDNGDEYLSMIACYAYDRKKHMDHKVGVEEGLVGQCFKERDEIYLTDVPSGYVKITSGLGEATPSCVLLVPVKTQDEIVGVLELASFRALLPYERHFIHKAAENIASAILSARTTQRIKKLLTESQQKAEELRSQEEEMRQNMEELTATQEEMARKAVETDSRVDAIENSGIAAVEFNLDGTIITANKHFLQLMEYSLSDIKGLHHSIFVHKADRNTEDYQKLWSDLRAGISRPGEYSRITRTGKSLFIKGSYSVIRDQSGRAHRLLKLATDMTPLRQREAALQEALAKLDAVRSSALN